MSMEPVLRNEWKYPVTEAQIALLRSRISVLMHPDPYADCDGIYHVRSLYFDDAADSCFYENENGTVPREKYRIRIYNGSADRILLECKSKIGNKTQKRACRITMEQAQMLISGRPITPLGDLPQLLRIMTAKQQQYGLRPAVIVAYDRLPFVYGPGNVRVTFDQNIASSKDFDGFFSKTLRSVRPVMPMAQHLMEVKFDEYFPGVVRSCLDLGRLQQTAYSKYYLCRKLSVGI